LNKKRQGGWGGICRQVLSDGDRTYGGQQTALLTGISLNGQFILYSGHLFMNYRSDNSIFRLYFFEIHCKPISYCMPHLLHESSSSSRKTFCMILPQNNRHFAILKEKMFTEGIELHTF
jgi:hypothetical protein